MRQIRQVYNRKAQLCKQKTPRVSDSCMDLSSSQEGKASVQTLTTGLWGLGATSLYRPCTAAIDTTLVAPKRQWFRAFDKKKISDFMFAPLRSISLIRPCRWCLDSKLLTPSENWGDKTWPIPHQKKQSVGVIRASWSVVKPR